MHWAWVMPHNTLGVAKISELCDSPKAFCTLGSSPRRAESAALVPVGRLSAPPAGSRAAWGYAARCCAAPRCDWISDPAAVTDATGTHGTRRGEPRGQHDANE